MTFFIYFHIFLVHNIIDDVADDEPKCLRDTLTDLGKPQKNLFLMAVSLRGWGGVKCLPFFIYIVHNIIDDVADDEPKCLRDTLHDLGKPQKKYFLNGGVIKRGGE